MLDNNNIFIALTYKCNAFCKKCMTRYHVNKQIEMPKTVLDRIISIFSEVKYDGYISVGTGEPLLYDKFSYFTTNMLSIESIKHFRLLTNGMLLFPENPRVVFDSRITWGITLDGFYQKSLLSVQKGVDINRVKDNIISICKKYGGSHIYLNFTIYDYNIDEILPFCKFAVENGVKEIYLTKLKVFSGYEDDLHDVRILKEDHLKEKVEEAIVFLKSQNIPTRGIDIFQKHTREKCYLKNAASPTIDVDGSVSFCSGREDVIIENIMDDNIEIKWKTFAETIQRKRINWCESCYDRIRLDGTYNLPKTIKKEKNYD